MKNHSRTPFARNRKTVNDFGMANCQNDKNKRNFRTIITSLCVEYNMQHAQLQCQVYISTYAHIMSMEDNDHSTVDIHQAASVTASAHDAHATFDVIPQRRTMYMGF